MAFNGGIFILLTSKQGCCRYTAEHQLCGKTGQSMIRHFLPLSFALPVRSLPGRVKTRSSQRLLISRTVTPQSLLTGLLAAIGARAVALPSVASAANAQQRSAALTTENPIVSPFHLSLNQLRLDLRLG
jgi:hypothetical protein